jgi:uncharacterized protein YegP (UPF0339 family)
MYFWLRANTAGQWTWSLHAANGENIAYGETYVARAAAANAIALVQGAPGNGCRFSKGQGSDRQWYWNLKATNGEIIARGEGYRAQADVDHVIQLVASTSAGTPVR